jgi:hypothetical protein
MGAQKLLFLTSAIKDRLLSADRSSNSIILEVSKDDDQIKKNVRRVRKDSAYFS